MYLVISSLTVLYSFVVRALYLLSLLQKKNKIAQGNVRIFSQLTIFIYLFIFFFFYEKYLSNRQSIVKFVIYGSRLVGIDTLLVKFK